jgi:hypothetical protein
MLEFHMFAQHRLLISPRIACPSETVAGQMPFGVSTKPGQCEAICGEACSAGHIQSEDAILDGQSDRTSEYQDCTAQRIESGDQFPGIGLKKKIKTSCSLLSIVLP